MNALKKNKAVTKSAEIKMALGIVWTPTMLTSVTTAIGFLSLIWINTEPVQLLGLFAAIGVLFAFIITFTFGLLIATIIPFSSQRRILEIPKGWLPVIQQQKKAVIGASILLLLVLIPGALKLRIDSFLLEDLPKDSNVRKDFDYADEYLGGSKPYEIRVEVMDSSYSVWDKEILDEIVKIESYLLNEYPIVKVQSPTTIIKYLTMVNNGGLNKYFQYPEGEKAFNETIKLKK